MDKTESYEPTVNPLIARLKAQMGKQTEEPAETEELQSDSRFGVLTGAARDKLKAALDNDDTVEITAEDQKAHAKDGKKFSSQATKLGHATSIPAIDKAVVTKGAPGVYKMTFEDGCYTLGWTNDLYGKIRGVVARINRNGLVRYPRGTVVTSYEVVSTLQSDLKNLKAQAIQDPQFIASLARPKKKAKKAASSVVTQYKDKLAGREDSTKSVNPLLQAHREEQAKNEGMSPLERLRKKAKSVTVSPQKSSDESSEVDWDAFDREFAEFEENITKTIDVPQSNCTVNWDSANLRWVTKPN
jgi:hypothetical protein